MKMHLPTAISREIDHWRHFFRTRDAALAKADPSRKRFADQHAADSGDYSDSFADTEWADTDWAVTNFDGEH